tara:strand:+ start:340 stop:543 length:204 start_codon:yes stop_codon:yes gene_type:complete
MNKDILYYRSEFNGDIFYISWNKSATFNVYFNNKEVDCFTDYVKNRSEAVESAHEYVKDNTDRGYDE